MLEPLIGRARERLTVLWRRVDAFSRREKTIAAICAAAISIWTVDALVIRPIKHSIVVLEERIAVQEKETLHRLKSVSQKPTVDAGFSRLEETLRLHEKGDEEARASMLEDVERIARLKGVDLSEVKPQAVAGEAREGKRAFAVRMQVDGSLDRLLVFLNELLKSDKLYLIQTFRMTPHPDGNGRIRAHVTANRILFTEH